MPPAVVKRATEVLAELEGRGSKEERRAAMRRANGNGGQRQQPSLFDTLGVSPTVEALLTPDIDTALDETATKRGFWQAFKAIGPWWSELPPY